MSDRLSQTAPNLVKATLPTIYLHLFFKIYMCFFQDLKMCKGLAVILRLIEVIIWQFGLSQFLDQLLPKNIYTGYLVNTNPPTILVESF